MANTTALWSKLRAAQALKTTPRVVSSGQGAYLTIAGSPYLNFCSSHYLGFAEEPRLKKAAQDAIEQYGLGTGYRTLSGTHALHVDLEKAIAEFKGTEAAVCFTSAYAANASAVQTLLGKEDIVVSDQLNHASIIDAVRVAGVKNKFAYAHSDMGDLEAKLAQASELQKTPKKNGEPRMGPRRASKSPLAALAEPSLPRILGAICSQARTRLSLSSLMASSRWMVTSRSCRRSSTSRRSAPKLVEASLLTEACWMLRGGLA